MPVVNLMRGDFFFRAMVLGIMDTQGTITKASSAILQYSP